MLKPPVSFVGIDPGKSGGIAHLNSDGDCMLLYRIPDTELDIAYELKLNASGRSVAAIEKVSSSPQMGVASAFTFGRGYGFLRGVLTANGIPFMEVRPQAWMKALGIRTKKKSESAAQWKDHLRGQAQQRFPSLELWKGTRNKGEQLAVCDALLIAEYCRITNRGE